MKTICDPYPEHITISFVEEGDESLEVGLLLRLYYKNNSVEFRRPKSMKFIGSLDNKPFTADELDLSMKRKFVKGLFK